jgi:hypothetical protein
MSFFEPILDAILATFLLQKVPKWTPDPSKIRLKINPKSMRKLGAKKT